MEAPRRKGTRRECACALHLRGRDGASILRPSPLSSSGRTPTPLLWASGCRNLCSENLLVLHKSG